MDTRKSPKYTRVVVWLCWMLFVPNILWHYSPTLSLLHRSHSRTIQFYPGHKFIWHLSPLSWSEMSFFFRKHGFPLAIVDGAFTHVSSLSCNSALARPSARMEQEEGSPGYLLPHEPLHLKHNSPTFPQNHCNPSTSHIFRSTSRSRRSPSVNTLHSVSGQS